MVDNVPIKLARHVHYEMPTMGVKGGEDKVGTVIWEPGYVPPYWFGRGRGQSSAPLRNPNAAYFDPDYHFQHDNVTRGDHECSDGGLRRLAKLVCKVK